DDLRESPLVTLAEQLIGKGVQLSIYDPDVQLSRLLGANRRFIETQLPHIGDLLKPDLDAIIAESEMLIVGVSNPAIFDAIATHSRAEQRIIDLVKLPALDGMRAQVEGLCW
ncbi:MAG: GDP-mannose dehydrogenase, partial [Betaproteobacteria bacterium HGW-Betaproteobacteria-21]